MGPRNRHVGEKDGMHDGMHDGGITYGCRCMHGWHEHMGSSTKDVTWQSPIGSGTRSFWCRFHDTLLLLPCLPLQTANGILFGGALGAFDELLGLLLDAARSLF